MMKKCFFRVLLFVGFFVLGIISLNVVALGQSKDQSIKVKIDFSKLDGLIKPLHGVNDGPFDYNPSAAPISTYFSEAHFPYVRLHDCNWPHPDVVDINTIFPIFNADPDNPENYTFQKTDDYVASIIQNKSQIIYRLGESIEHRTQYFIHPPRDYKKWAKICVHIIRHYNDGWDNGFHYNIKYWEIWNEPEGKSMWLGTQEQYFQLYKTAVKAIKTFDSSLQVGGPAAKSAKSGIVIPFLSYCKENNLPLDFFSWHMYTDTVANIVNDAKYVRKLLDQYGFFRTKNFLDEWHYMDIPFSMAFPEYDKIDTGLAKYSKVAAIFSRINGPEAAAFAGSVLMRLQQTPIDVAAYYNADYDNPFSMFNVFGIPGKVYYVFEAFNQLVKDSMRVSCVGDKEDPFVTSLATISEGLGEASILISNNSSSDKISIIRLRNLPFHGVVEKNIYCINKTDNLNLIKSEKIPVAKTFSIKLNMAPFSVYLMKLNQK